mmetsp:Transcript_4616/g.13142  ORF Transcript_4616/g.13142 Transcript_4616/m.13142 type:complete len:346 (-) Transcript_4616:165-1202(-)
MRALSTNSSAGVGSSTTTQTQTLALAMAAVRALLRLRAAAAPALRLAHPNPKPSPSLTASARRCFCNTKNGSKPTAEPKVEPKVEPRVEPKADPKAEPKADPKAEPKVEPKAGPKAEPAPQAEAVSRPSASGGGGRRGPATPITWLSVGLSGLVGLGVYLYYENEKAQRLQQAVSQQKVIGKAALGGPFTLVDAADGRPVTDMDYRGKYLLMYFGFSRCPDICPSELVKMGGVLDKLGKAADKFQPLYISVDPQRDSLKQLKNYARDFHPGIRYLTGTPDQCAAAAKVYRVYHSKADDVDEDEYLVDHSIVIYFVGPDGEFIDFFTQRMTEADILEKIRAHAPGL